MGLDSEIDTGADIGSLAAKFSAIVWLIESNDSLLDAGDLRRLRRFGRDLSVLAGGTNEHRRAGIRHSLA
jgi:hypothetical protein